MADTVWVCRPAANAWAQERVAGHTEFPEARRVYATVPSWRPFVYREDSGDWIIGCGTCYGNHSAMLPTCGAQGVLFRDPSESIVWAVLRLQFSGWVCHHAPVDMEGIP